MTRLAITHLRTAQVAAEEDIRPVATAATHHAVAGAAPHAVVVVVAEEAEEALLIVLAGPAATEAVVTASRNLPDTAANLRWAETIRPLVNELQSLLVD